MNASQHITMFHPEAGRLATSEVIGAYARCADRRDAAAPNFDRLTKRDGACYFAERRLRVDCREARAVS